MTNKNYINKYGVMYGVSSKCVYGRWEHTVVAFDNADEAEGWLNSEQYDFRERELCSKSKAIELVGKDAVENAFVIGE